MVILKGRFGIGDERLDWLILDNGNCKYFVNYIGGMLTGRLGCDIIEGNRVVDRKVQKLSVFSLQE